jgi:hypothetical protein
MTIHAQRLGALLFAFTQAIHTQQSLLGAESCAAIGNSILATNSAYAGNDLFTFGSSTCFIGAISSVNNGNDWQFIASSSEAGAKNVLSVSINTANGVDSSVEQ